MLLLLPGRYLQRWRHHSADLGSLHRVDGKQEGGRPGQGCRQHSTVIVRATVTGGDSDRAHVNGDRKQIAQDQICTGKGRAVVQLPAPLRQGQAVMPARFPHTQPLAIQPASDSQCQNQHQQQCITKASKNRREKSNHNG